MKIQEGGPAFPYQLANRSDSTMKVFGVDLPPGKTADFGGMTLRDYFAARAMNGMCSHVDTWGMTVPQIAKRAYDLADEMLRVRELP
ncbi:hypothetical protein CICRMM096B_06180 [Citrobacter cronae]|uniref:hypothetical protein n=1 Tax=Citrobacter cronae TaxID=1748967 RepID=UPI00350FB305